ncbi:MAG: RecX family transcriptional regulator [Firmicutes bacterium]|nr:RecX family transcriptional regulator [Bacillota bacterium]
MLTITELSAQKKNKQRTSVYLDGSFVCGLQTLTVMQHKLKLGQEITLEELERIQLESDAGTAFERAIGILSSRLKTEREIKNYLLGKGYLTPVVNSVIDKLKEYKYINDETYTESFVRTYSSGSGKRKLSYDLLHKGVSKETIDAALAEHDGSESCLLLAQKFLRNKELTRENLGKVSRRLAGRGFSFSEIKQALSRLTDIEFE